MSEIVDGFLFQAGWWSVGTWLAFVTTLLVIIVGISRGGPLWSVLLALSGPFVAFALIPILRGVANPAPGCISECEGRLVILAVSAGVLLGWAIGLAVAGFMYLRRRRTLAR